MYQETISWGNICYLILAQIQGFKRKHNFNQYTQSNAVAICSKKKNNRKACQHAKKPLTCRLHVIQVLATVHVAVYDTLVKKLLISLLRNLEVHVSDPGTTMVDRCEANSSSCSQCCVQTWMTCGIPESGTFCDFLSMPFKKVT